MSVQFFLSQASGTKHLSDLDIIYSSPDKEKLVLSYSEGFSKDHSPTLSLSPHSPPSSPALCIHFCKLIFGFKAFSISLSLVLRLSSTYPICHSSLATEALIPASDHPLKHSAITQLSDFPTSICVFPFILPFLPLLLVSSSFFLCQLFSATYIRTDIWLMKNMMPLSSLYSPMYHLYPSVLYWFLLRWKAQTESAYCSVLVQRLTQWNPIHVPDMAYGMVTCNITCIYHVMYGDTVQI